MKNLVYVLAGFLLVMGVYDMSVQRTGVTVQVVETVTEEDQVEIICPDVIHPGDYFTCVVDIPTGTDLKAKIEEVKYKLGKRDTVQCEVTNQVTNIK